MKKSEKDFYKGFALAVALIIRTHGEDVVADDVAKEGSLTLERCIEAGVDEYDMEVLRPLFAERKRRNEALGRVRGQ